MDTRTEFPFGDGSKEPLYLTSGTCEVTQEYDDLLDKHNLPYGEFDGSFYPLTDAEAVYIADDMLMEVADGFGALTGYSALYQGKKYLMPSIEIGWGEDFGAANADEALDFANRFKAEIENRVSETGGHVILGENEGVDRHTVKVLVPFEYAAKVASDYQEWSDHLETTLLASKVTLDDVRSAAPKI